MDEDFVSGIEQDEHFKHFLQIQSPDESPEDEDEGFKGIFLAHRV